MVERIFGVFKREFALMEAAPEYSMDMQAKFIPATGALHNYAAIHQPKNQRQTTFLEPSGSQISITSDTATSNVEPRTVTEEELGFNITPAERRRAETRRDEIARRMWVDYQEELRRRQNN